MNFIPATRDDYKKIMKRAGINNIKDLFVDIPKEHLLKESLNLPKSLSEIELKREVEEIASQNKQKVSFLGGGSYNHFVPSTVNTVISRGEFYTAYTPYQPEISQGTLQAIFEYQSMICDITGKDICNASLYDGATAFAEGMFMATRIKRKKKVLVSKAVNPNYRKVLKTYAHFNNIEIVEMDLINGETDLTLLNTEKEYAAVLIQQPNYFGIIEDLDEIKDKLNDSLLVTSTNEALSWGILKQLPSDIITGEGQSFGLGMNFGGPCLGIMATNKEYMRQMPGRIIGETTDTKGDRGFVLTLSTREQHIRREKATSNICSNEGLCALSAAVYLSTVGTNLRELALFNNKNANYFSKKLESIGIKLVYKKPFFNEFVVQTDKKIPEDIEFGIPLEKDYPDMPNCYLVCCTELTTLDEMNYALEVLQ